jgi:ectoine hydroxylase-related dioxygenase (phytanoyl-CoA dioxygenase family)
MTMDAPAADFDELHRRTLPDRIATPLGAAASRDGRDAPSLAFRVAGGRAYRFLPSGDAIRIEPGDDVGVVVELALDAWRDFVGEIATAAGLFYGGRVRFARGDEAKLGRWEPALRALLSGRPIFDPERDVARDPGAFTLEASNAELRRALDDAGFVLVKRVFTRDEVARLADVVASRQASARPGDGRSWWATTAGGARVLCRLVYLGLAERDIAALNDDARLRRLASLAPEPLRPALDRADGHSVVIKNPDVVEGLSDLPWHRDCGLGGHPITCPTINIGLQLDAATAETGRLHIVPGSWRFSCHRRDLDRAPAVAIDTEPGDCTVHFGDVMHAAPPPTGAGPGRRAIYTTWMPARAYERIPAGESYNDVILRRVGG